MFPDNAHHQMLVTKDDAIERHNKRLKKSHNFKVAADTRLQSIQDQPTNPAGIEKALQTKARADIAYARATTASLQIIGSGSGKVPILLPSDIVSQRSSSMSRGSM